MLNIARGQSQFQAATAACQDGTPLSGAVEYRHRYLDFHGLFVEAAQVALPTAALGRAFLFGASGHRTGNFDRKAAGLATQLLRTVSSEQAISEEMAEAHRPKDIFLTVGHGPRSPAAWAPHIL